MQQENNKNATSNPNVENEREKDPLPPEVVAAHEQAEADIEDDDELSTEEDPTDDLDEGEMARLDNNTDNTEV